MGLRNVLIGLGVIAVLLLAGGFTLIIIGSSQNKTAVSSGEEFDQRAALRSGRASADEPPPGTTYDQREALRARRQAAE